MKKLSSSINFSAKGLIIYLFVHLYLISDIIIHQQQQNKHDDDHHHTFIIRQTSEKQKILILIK